MVRSALFDPADRNLFNQQRQRFDWSLLQNGHVFRYDTAFPLDSACGRLTGLGYLVHRIDAHAWTSVEDMYDAFAHAIPSTRATWSNTSFRSSSPILPATSPTSGRC